MIAVLRKLGVEPQAIEQPLDLDIPENKMMLAIYLTAPEIENDRRGLNTFYGLRRARKEGRWPGLAPVGYINKTGEDGKKYIAPDGNQAELMKWAFKEISKGIISTEQIFKRAVENGLCCSKNNFLRLIRNPIYAGNITIPKYKDEESYVVKGIHEALISISLFEQVQDVLSGKVRIAKTKIVVNDQIPLKGFLRCSKCTRVLCGSASKGRSCYYYYYHCCSTCGCRHKAYEVNETLIKFLSEFNLSQNLAQLLKTAILEVYANNTKANKDNKFRFAREITINQNKINKARELLLTGDIESDDYRAIKKDCEKNIAIAEEALNDLNSKVYTLERLEPIVNKAIHTLSSLNLIYSKSSTEEKRKIIGSMFPEKVTFENLKDRTAKIAEPYRYIFLINSNLNSKKTGQKTFKNLLPREG
jgi:hypothetical protein